MFKYFFNPTYIEAGKLLLTAETVCDRYYQGQPDQRRQCKLEAWESYCNTKGRSEANDAFENDLIGAMTDFYNKMLICDNTYRNTDCCVATDN